MSRILAFDVGGANLKVASSDGWSLSQAFAMWKDYDSLSMELRKMLDLAPYADEIVATMTGELADCFSNKQEGVAYIAGALEETVGSARWSIYLTDGSLVSPDQAVQKFRLAAASNWHALAAFVGSHAAWRNGVLLDIGSTTCDVIPIVEGQVAARGKDDLCRLLNGELVYVGVERTPVVSLVSELPYRGQACPIARELFATSLDACLIAGHIAERPADCQTADGRPATREHAIARLGRCVCADEHDWEESDAVLAANHVVARMVCLIGNALRDVLDSFSVLNGAPLIVSGHGEFLLPSILDQGIAKGSIVLLRDMIGEEASRCAPAYGLARLAYERRNSQMGANHDPNH